MKSAIAFAWLFVLATGIAAIFWHTQWVYNLPTPVPEGYQPVQKGESINTGLVFQNSDKPVFLHFFNPDCPCSKFNMPHFRSLVTAYSGKANFAVVVMTAKTYTAAQIQKKYDIDIPVIFDTTLAPVCGVYSTPQAVIINEQKLLHYRGNYNKNRYCTDKKTNYAQQALEALLQHHSTPRFDAFALKAYGCSLPQCTKP